MKKKYKTPQMQTILFRGPVVMVTGSTTVVNGFTEDSDAYIGDTD